MKKLLISLCALGLSSIAFANDLPTGHYSGSLKTPSGATVNGQGDSSAGGINVRLDPLPDLANTPGNLSANISLSAADCFSGSGHLTLDKAFIGTKTWLSRVYGWN